MEIRFGRFFLDEKNIFIFVFGAVIIMAKIFNLSLSPFRFESLLVVFLFLLTTRSLIESQKFFPYIMIAIIGLALSVLLSPYSLLIYFVIALILYKKTNLIG